MKQRHMFDSKFGILLKHGYQKKYFLALYLSFNALRYVIMIWHDKHDPLTPAVGFAVILLLSIGSFFNIRYVTKILCGLIILNSIGALALVGYAIYRNGTADFLGYTLNTTFLTLLVGTISIFFLMGAVRLWRQ